jgi:hypothetical protein
LTVGFRSWWTKRPRWDIEAAVCSIAVNSQFVHLAGLLATVVSIILNLRRLTLHILLAWRLTNVPFFLSRLSNTQVYAVRLPFLTAIRSCLDGT